MSGPRTVAHVPAKDREEKRVSRKVAEPRGDRLRAFRQAVGLTQEELAERADLDRVEVARIENGWNQGTSTRICFGLARAFRLWPETMEAVLAGELAASAAQDRVGEADLKERATPTTRSPRLRDRPEWGPVLAEAKVLAKHFYGTIADDVWESVGDVQDSLPFPRPLTPAFVANLAHAIHAAHAT